MAKDRRKKKRGPFFWGLAVLGSVTGVVALIILFNYTDLIRAPGKQAQPPPVKPVPAEPEKPAAKPPEKTETAPPPEARHYARVAIVIDDMGQDIKKLNELLKIDAPIAIAVLPNLKYSKETAGLAYRSGHEVLLHLPMEPRDSVDNDPGKGALFTAMTSDEVSRQVEDDFRTVPFAIGINNHMGSKFTEDEALMRTVLEVVRRRHLFFLDSRTTSNSVAGRLAREMGLKNAERNVFLDNTRDRTYIKAQIAELAAIAKKRGSAIGIGHPYPETIEALKGSVADLSADGIEFVRLSELLK